ncbi:MAG: efflux RND transporter periplasmic adaptor subunit [Chthoniobacterales bacterium]
MNPLPSKKYPELCTPRRSRHPLKEIRVPLFNLRTTTVFLTLLCGPLAAEQPIILTDTATKNLGIELATAEESNFEETIFALGVIDVLPGHRAAVSSRIAGRATEVFIQHDHFIQAGEPAVIVESRQPGNPPPSITLDAPISGLVTTTNVAIGKPVDPDESLAEIIDVDAVYAVARVPEHLAARLSPGIPARIVVPAVGPKAHPSRLEHLGSEADPESGTVEAAFRVENPNHALRPGMRAEFSIVVAERKNVMSVPREAIQGDPSNRVVYVADFELPNAFHRAPVEIGLRNDQSVEILSGLFPGDEVVTTGSYLLGFAGGNASISLKEALDAAHGHEHAEDGSELTAADRAARAAAANPDAAPASAITPLTTFLAITCAILLLLLIASLLRRPA